MKTDLLTRLFAIALIVGVVSCYASAEPLQQKKEKERQALIDEADAPAPTTAPAATAPATDPAANQGETASQQEQQAAQPACEPAEQQKEESGVPILPIVLASIGTIAFIVLAIIF